MQGTSGLIIWLSLLTLAELFSSISAGTLRITRVGRYLYDAKGNRFYIKGVAFQPPSGKPNDPTAFKDPLADPPACNQAIGNFNKLQINVVHVYAYDHKLDHTPCMNALEKAGIHVIADISLSSSGAINPAAPTWTVDHLASYTKQIDSLRKFPNLLAFNIGNEIITSNDSLEAGPFIKAAARDVKAYLNSVDSHALVAYASADGKKFPAELARFLSCDPSGKSPGLDLYGVNNYRWCGESNFEAAYEDLTLDFQGLSIAAFFSEIGCLTPGKPRGWSEVPAIFSTLMSDLWSGAIAFNYFPTHQGYGLVNEKKPPEVNQDFKNLADQYRKVKPPNMPKLTTLGQGKQQCVSTNANSFVIAKALPPEPNGAACSCVEQAALSCQVSREAFGAAVEELLEQACNFSGTLVKRGLKPKGACSPVSPKPKKGKYGLLSACPAPVRLNFVLSYKFAQSGFNPKACTGNASVVPTIQPKNLEDLELDTKRCFDSHSNKALRQITSDAYQESLSGARAQLSAKSSASSLAPRSRPIIIGSTISLLGFIHHVGW